MMQEEYLYQKAWRNYRRWLRLMMFLTALMLVMFLILSLVTSRIAQEIPAVTIIVILVVIALILIRMTFWKCPRCRKFYFRWWDRMQVLFGKRCQNCKLERYEGSNIKGIFSNN